MHNKLFFFSFLKKRGLKNIQTKKQKKNQQHNYLIIVPIKMRLLIFLVFIVYGLACK